MFETSLPALISTSALPSFQEILSRTRVLQIPMRVKFRGLMLRETMLIEGDAGWGEFAAFTEYQDREAMNWVAAALEAAYLGFPEQKRQQIPLNSTVPAVSADQVGTVLANYRGEIHEVKIKVAEKGQSLCDDLARVRAVQEHLPGARLKVDANGGWEYEQAMQALEALEEFNLLYVEQPVMQTHDLARIKEHARSLGLITPIAADESVRKASDPLKVAQMGAADVLIVKAAPLGGVRRAAAIVQQAGLPAVVSSALESSVGISMGAALAASLPDLPFGCGLGTVSLMEKDVTGQPLIAQDGLLTNRQINPDPGLLDQLQAPRDRVHWWQQRLIRCLKLLGQQESHAC